MTIAHFFFRFRRKTKGQTSKTDSYQPEINPSRLVKNKLSTTAELNTRNTGIACLDSDPVMTYNAMYRIEAPAVNAKVEINKNQDANNDKTLTPSGELVMTYNDMYNNNDKTLAPSGELVMTYNAMYNTDIPTTTYSNNYSAIDEAKVSTTESVREERPSQIYHEIDHTDVERFETPTEALSNDYSYAYSH